MPRFVRGGRGLWRSIQRSRGEGYSSCLNWSTIFALFCLLLIGAACVTVTFAPILGFLLAGVFTFLVIYFYTRTGWDKGRKTLFFVSCIVLAVLFLICGIVGVYTSSVFIESTELEQSSPDFNFPYPYENVLKNIEISNETYTLTAKHYSTYHDFRATFRSKMGKKFSCYATLTLYLDDYEVYKVCTYIWEYQSGREDVAIQLRVGTIPKFTSYKWEALREKPEGLEYDGI